jgi:hypothetical protein
MILGIVGVVAGLAILLAGVATSLPIVGVLGFLATVAGAFVAYNAFSAKAATETANGTSTPQAAPKASAGNNSALMDRLEERWRKRRDGRDQL